MNEIEITVKGNATSAVELRPTATGKTFARFTVASAERIYDRTSGVWADGTTTYFVVKCWGVLAQNVADSVSSGVPVIVHGRLNTYRYEREVGKQTIPVTAFEITAYAVGPDLGRGVAEFRRTKSQAVRRAENRALAEVGLAPMGDGSAVGGGG